MDWAHGTHPVFGVLATHENDGLPLCRLLCLKEINAFAITKISTFKMKRLFAPLFLSLFYKTVFSSDLYQIGCLLCTLLSFAFFQKLINLLD